MDGSKDRAGVGIGERMGSRFGKKLQFHFRVRVGNEVGKSG